MVHSRLGIELSKLGVGVGLKDTKSPCLKKSQHSCTEHFKLKVKEHIPGNCNKTPPLKSGSKQTIASEHIALPEKRRYVIL